MFIWGFLNPDDSEQNNHSVSRDVFFLCFVFCRYNPPPKKENFTSDYRLKELSTTVYNQTESHHMKSYMGGPSNRSVRFGTRWDTEKYQSHRCVFPLYKWKVGWIDKKRNDTYISNTINIFLSVNSSGILSGETTAVECYSKDGGSFWKRQDLRLLWHRSKKTSKKKAMR